MLFGLIDERYERKTIAFNANAPFSARHVVFPNKAMTAAALNGLMNHSTIMEMNVDSQCRRGSTYLTLANKGLHAFKQGVDGGA